MSCIFNVNDLDNSLELLGESLMDRLSPIPDYGLTNVEDVKLEILRQIKDVSESFQINPENVDAALLVFDDDSLFWGMEDATPSKEDLKDSMLSWLKLESTESENTSTSRLDNTEKNVERVKDDPLAFAYGRALKAKIRATQHANTVGVHSILYDENGIINTVEDLNYAIVNLLEKLLKNILNFLRKLGISIDGTMYNEENYTGIVEELNVKYGKLFKYDFNELNDLYNNNDFEILDAISSWVILNNFDTILENTFGKAITINPDKSKYDSTKYSVAGGSNVYTTWRTNEEIDLSKEINNISLAIITSIPYYVEDSPSNERNLKFNEFIYLISKLKDIPHNLKHDVIFQFEEGLVSKETKDYLEGKSLSYIINTLRDNPQKYLPIILEALNNKNIFEIVKSNLTSNYFASVDKDIINTIYLGIFNLANSNSLYSILKKSGFEGINYYSFITQTVDSTFKSNFLLYFRNPEGEIYARPMYDLSLYVIGENIKGHINNLSSLVLLSDYNFEDNTSDIDIQLLAIGSNYFTINGIEYNVSVLQNDDGSKVFQYKDITGKEISDKSIIDKLNLAMKAKYSNPSVVSFTYNNYYKGPLKVEVNLLDGKITYSVNGIQEKFSSIKDFNSLLPLIEDILRLNFDIDTNYLNAYLNRISQLYVSPYGDAAAQLMLMTSRVLVNKYLLENYIKYIPFNEIREKLNKIFGEPKVSYKPTYNRKLHELNYLTDAETSIINNLAQAKALVTGRLTSSQILDGEGNALASSSLSRLQNSLDYQVEVQVKLSNAAAKDFTLWKPGVYKGIFLLKEMKDNSTSTSKAHIGFSSKEMENALVFIDFLQGLVTKGSTRSPYTDGVVGFYPSENSDKTYVGRILIDLQAIPVGESNLYELLRTNPGNIILYLPIIRQELYNFYKIALDNINSEWNKLYKIGLNVSYGNWSDLYNEVEAYNAELEDKNKLTPVLYLKRKITDYNFNNPFDPITLIENVHYVEDSNGNIIRNDSFMANLSRLESDEEFYAFMLDQEEEVLKHLLLDGISIDGTQELRNLLGEEWIDKNTNKVILAKQNGRDIRRYRDFDENSPIQLNPLLSAYNSLNYFFTQEYINSSVGAYYAHPNKKSKDSLQQLQNGEINNEQAIKNILEDEKARKLAQDKRNVSFTAAMHAMLKNLIQGIPSIANIAIMPDTKDSFETISGDLESGIKPYDGATFTNPFFAILQNYSLGGAKVGNIKKTFTHYYDEKTGTGGIIKTAEFPLTNEYIRRSKFYKNMMLNMTDRVWRDLNGNLCNVDITTDYNGNPIIFHNPESDLGYMYFLDDVTGEYYIFNIEKTDSPNTYIRHKQKVDKYGLPIELEFESETFVITTNFDLWKMFGGEYSMSFNKGKFHLSEHSIKQVVDIMNKTTVEGVKLSNVETQEDVWQPLKHSDIHLMPTVGAVKLGAANVNEVSSYQTADSSKINHFRIRMNLVGVQLDKEHHADGEDLSIMTLVLSACASRGYTPEMTLNLYNVMAKLAEAGIRPYLKNFEQFFKVSENPNATPQQLEVARQNFENTLLDTLIKALANSTNTSSTLQIITLELLEKAKEGKEIDFAKLNVPLSDPAVMRKLHSTISVALTRAAIKIKVDGSLNMLCPSYGIVKIYDGRMYEDFLNDKEITDRLMEWNNNPMSNLIGRISDIKLGRHYLATTHNGEEILLNIQTPEDYWELKQNISRYKSIKELFASYVSTSAPKHSLLSPEEILSQLTGNIDSQISKAQELGLEVRTLEPQTLEEFVAVNFPKLNSDSFIEETGILNFTTEGKLGFFNNKTGKSITRAAEDLVQSAREAGILFENELDIRNIIIDFITGYNPSQLKNYIKESRLNEALENHRKLYEDELAWIDKNTKTEFFEGGRDLASYNITFSGNIQIDEAFGAFATQQIIELFNLYDLVSVKNLHDLKKSKNYTKQQLDKALSEVQKDLSTLHSKHGQVLTDKGMVEILPESINIESYEIVLPKIFATVFGLTLDDNLNSIKQDPNFFTKRLILNLSPKHSDYTICLQRINGDHVYILNSDLAILTQYFKPKLIQQTREKGKLYRQLDDELLYEMGENDLVWERINPDGTTTEVIVTDSPLSYLDRISYITLNLNRKNSEEVNLSYINELKNSKNKNVQRYLEAFNTMMSRPGETFDNALEDIQEISLLTYNDSPVGIFYKNLGDEIYASFLKSLEVVAARIPAQSMLSFMPMKVVGFEKSDRNTAYVSTTQILFQGSDYDIDSVSIASYAFDESGRYIIHSPLANISSYKLLKASEQLPFPTGKILEINDEELYDYSQLFDGGPFRYVKGNRIELDNNSVESIEKLKLFIEDCNKKGYIPSSIDPSMSLAVNAIRALINRHNDYINTSKDVEKFSKNYMVSSMYNIGISPANLIESQQAMDSITGPLKLVASQTLKALQQQSTDNPADYTTNIRGFVQNMDGKQGVGIVAVGLKGFFAATARYNDVLNNGTPEEIERLKSDVTIAGKRFRILANTYTTNEVSQAILGEILTLLDLGKDAALILSGLLSLATDNAKELALTKLNAANMLGMYIYGISIGMDFLDIAKIIASKTGQVIDSLIKEDVMTGDRSMNMENIFDYLELGPKINYSEQIPRGISDNYGLILNQKILRDLAWRRAYINNEGKLTYLKEEEVIPKSAQDLISYYESQKRDPKSDTYPYHKGTIEYNRNIEKAQDYIQHVTDVITDFVDLGLGRVGLHYTGKVNSGVYGDLKKLYEGGEEMRRLGLLLHINQGNETSYDAALGYIDKVESAISSAQYRKYREYSRYKQLNREKAPTDYSKLYELNFHKFVTNLNYREGCIDLYGGICRKDLFMNSSSYREMFINVFDPDKENLEEQYTNIISRLRSSKAFFNILDILNIPHYFLYLRSADMLHLYMQNSIKYRGIYKLGKRAIEEIGAFSEKDRETIFRRTEQLIDRLLRDRFFISLEINFEIPVGKEIFVKDGETVKRLSVKNSPAIIKLGTREGNASFKLLMEETIIPELQKMDRFKENKFIQSLGTVLFSANPELQVTRCIAPNINMSPRSDTDSALFEEIKHDFNTLRTTDYKYLSGGIKHDLIDLFYYYNLIAFGGRVGENTMTNIFQDVLDYRNIKNFRDYESFQDKYGEFDLILPGVKGNISLDTLLRETAPRANELSTKLNYFYSEDWKTGELSFNSRNKGGGRSYTDDSGETVRIAKYSHNPVVFTTEEDAKDYLVQSTESDIVQAHFNLSTGQPVVIKIEKGSITDINIDGVSIEIPFEDKEFFRKLKTISRLKNGVLEKYYNKKEIISKIEEIVSCK